MASKPRLKQASETIKASLGNFSDRNLLPLCEHALILKSKRAQQGLNGESWGRVVEDTRRKQVKSLATKDGSAYWNHRARWGQE